MSGYGKLADAAVLYLYLYDSSDNYNVELVNFMKNNIVKINKNGIYIYVQCFKKDKISKDIKKELSNKGINRFPSLLDRNTYNIITGTNNIIKFLGNIAKPKKQKEKYKSDKLMDTSEEDIDDYMFKFIKNKEDNEEDDRKAVARDMQAKAQERQSKISRSSRQNNFGNDDGNGERDTMVQDYRDNGGHDGSERNTPSNRPSAQKKSKQNKKMQDDDDDNDSGYTYTSRGGNKMKENTQPECQEDEDLLKKLGLMEED